MSRAHILNKATEYIRQMQRGSAQRLGEIDDLKKKNELLEEQCKLEVCVCVCVVSGLHSVQYKLWSRCKQ